ncbi:MAG TPA: PP0621 family protein [Burkholderiales bacterium]|nr:PP0621 family protein [Burkholderiales bacterium]
MGRLLVLVMLVVVAAWLVRRALRRADMPGAAEAGTVSDELVRCAHCGLLLPRAEARESAGAIYCSDEHARLGPTRGR